MNKNKFWEIALQILLIIGSFFLDILKEIWKPFLIKGFKILLLAAFAFFICQVIPHDLGFVNSISYIGWTTIITLYNIITFKFDDVDNTENKSEFIEAQFDETNANELIERDETYGSTRE